MCWHSHTHYSCNVTKQRLLELISGVPKYFHQPSLPFFKSFKWRKKSECLFLSSIWHSTERYSTFIFITGLPGLNRYLKNQNHNNTLEETIQTDNVFIWTPKKNTQVKAKVTPSRSTKPEIGLHHITTTAGASAKVTAKAGSVESHVLTDSVFQLAKQSDGQTISLWVSRRNC